MRLGKSRVGLYVFVRNLGDLANRCSLAETIRSMCYITNP